MRKFTPDFLCRKSPVIGLSVAGPLACAMAVRWYDSKIAAWHFAQASFPTYPLASGGMDAGEGDWLAGPVDAISNMLSNIAAVSPFNNLDTERSPHPTRPQQQ